MRIQDLGLRPCLQENLPATIQTKMDVAMIKKIDKARRLKKIATRYRRVLNHMIQKINAS